MVLWRDAEDERIETSKLQRGPNTAAFADTSAGGTAEEVVIIHGGEDREIICSMAV